MNALDIAQNILHLAPKRVASTRGGEYSCGCPVCGGNKRFRVWPNKGEYGTWMCRECEKGGDAIELLRFAKGMTFKEACELLGRELKARPRGSALRAPRSPKSEAPDFIPREITDPAELWQARAAAFARSAHRELLGNKDQLAWLAERGITVETVKRFNLGWNPKALFLKRTTWGLPEDTIKVKKESEDPDTPPEVIEKKRVWLWLPMGLIIPYFAGERVHRLRIRRPEEDLDDRYYVVPGSGMAPFVVPGPNARAWFVVESELDAVLSAQDAGDLVSVAALGSVSVKPDDKLHGLLKASDMILSALDYDRAGAKAKQWWLRTYPQADRWPTPSGKDPGDYRKDGGDIRVWIIAGLPYGLRPVEPVVARSEATRQSPETKEAKTETIAAKAETETAKSETIAAQGDALKHNGQFDKKACLPVCAPDADTPALTPLRTFQQKCPDCGTVEEVRVYHEPRGYVRPKKCYQCLLKPPTETPRKRAWQ